MSTFGVTMHGPPNGQAVLTLSLFNMSHPLDRAWCKKSFDTTSGASGKLSAAEIDAFLCCFYRARAEGETLSGGFVPRSAGSAAGTAALERLPDAAGEVADRLGGMHASFVRYLTRVGGGRSPEVVMREQHSARSTMRAD